jgi:hypothetical protein
VGIRLPGQTQSKGGPHLAVEELQAASMRPRDRGAEGETQARATRVPTSGAVWAPEPLEVKCST